MSTSIESPPISSTHVLLMGIWSHFSRRRRIQFSLLLVVMIASGVAELVSLGAVLPFLALLSNPQRLWQEPIVRQICALAGFSEVIHLLLPATLAFVIATLIAALIRLANLWLNGHLAAAVGSDLSCEAYRRTLYQPYSVHLTRNTASVINGVTTQINRTIVALTYFLQLLTAAVVCVALFAGLLLINWAVALGASILFGGIYGLLALTTRRKLQQNSKKIASAAKQQIIALQEGIGAIRDVLLDGNQRTYVEIYRQSDLPQRQLQANNQFLGAFPRYVVEALGMVAIALLGWLLVVHQGSTAAMIPLLGAFALGAQRMLPALQQVYGAWSGLKGFNADLAGVLAMLNQPLPASITTGKYLPFFYEIRLEDLRFNYLSDTADILQNINLVIRRGERIGLIGRTGSGKSTLVDLLMGLLEPTAGRVLVDGLDLHDPDHPERLLSWRAAIAHVPQSIYLADSSFAENIAFGVPYHKIDVQRVKQAAEHAQIASFIEASPNGYQSFVGERGIRISGGQRQRIGIARALYKNARVLVLDEATSALDSSTEEAVMSYVEALRKELTIVMIAHRLSTLKHCDRIIRLDKGLIEIDGTPKQVLRSY